MSDLYGALAKLYPVKTESDRSIFASSDLEQQTTRSSSLSGFKQMMFSQTSQEQDANNRPMQFVIGKMNDQRDYTKAFIFFAVSALFLFFAFITLPMIIVSPQKFTMLFTLSMLSMLVALAFLNGPASYARKLSERRNIVASFVMAASIVLSLYFSVIQSSYLLSLLFCFIEVSFACYDHCSSTQSCFSSATHFQRERPASSCSVEQPDLC